jgi:hypothetical protein
MARPMIGQKTWAEATEGPGYRLVTEMTLLVIDAILAGLALTYVLPALDDQTRAVAVVVGVVGLVWKWRRDFWEY